MEKNLDDVETGQITWKDVLKEFYPKFKLELDNAEQTLEKIQKQVFHVKCKNKLSDSILNFFTMAIGFFMFGCIHAEIIFSENIKYYFYGNIIIAGIAQSLLGIYD